MANKKSITPEQKEVLAAKKREYYQNNKADILAKRKIYRNENSKIIKEKKKLYRNKNKSKISETHKKWSLLNPEKRKEKQRQYSKDNRESLNSYRKGYRVKNKEIVNMKRRAYENTKLSTDNLFKVKHLTRLMVRRSFKQHNYNKNTKTAFVIGCSYEEFKIHLESKFEPWMNWQNHGLYNGTKGYGWDIDHKVPLSSAKTEEDVIRLNHYTNLQPLCSYVNRVVKRN